MSGATQVTAQTYYVAGEDTFYGEHADHPRMREFLLKEWADIGPGAVDSKFDGVSIWASTGTTVLAVTRSRLNEQGAYVAETTKRSLGSLGEPGYTGPILDEVKP